MTKNISKVQRILHSTDISMFEVLPAKVICPKEKEDVKKAIKNAKQEHLTVHARGCGTSTAGQSLGEGILMDFSRNMDGIIEIKDNYVDIEPGIVLGKLNETLRPLGLFMPVDPSSAEVCSVGGMVSNNSSGIHSYMYGDTKDYVIGLEGYFADGNFFSTITGEGTKSYLDALDELRPEAVRLFDKVPKTLKDSSGYNIKETFSLYGPEMLTRLIVGSEGTLCIITKIRLKLISLPKERATILALFSELERALEAVTLSNKISRISAIELLDKELIETSRKHFADIRDYFSEGIKAGLIFEIDGEVDEVRASLNELKKVLSYIALKIDASHDQEKRKKLWWMRRSASSILNRIEGSSRTLRFIEDIAVPVESISEFYREEKKILDSFGLPTAFFGHIGSGHFHINPKIDTRDPDFLEVIDSVSEKTYSLVKKLNGTIAGEHGDGLLRTPYIKRFDPDLHAFFVKIKKVFDPDFILNPDKIVSVKEAIVVGNRYIFDPIHNLDPHTLNEIEKCHGCNDCLNFCSSLNNHKNDEGLKARGRANLLRAIVSGLIGKDEYKEAVMYIERCRLCTKCAVMCPTGIDIISTAAMLREKGIIPISMKRKILMYLMTPVKTMLVHRADKCKKGDTLRLNLLDNKAIRLGLYYNPYLKKFFEAVTKKKLSLKSGDKDLELYLARF